MFETVKKFLGISSDPTSSEAVDLNAAKDQRERAEKTNKETTDQLLSAASLSRDSDREKRPVLTDASVRPSVLGDGGVSSPTAATILPFPGKWNSQEIVPPTPAQPVKTTRDEELEGNIPADDLDFERYDARKSKVVFLAKPENQRIREFRTPVLGGESFFKKDPAAVEAEESQWSSFGIIEHARRAAESIAAVIDEARSLIGTSSIVTNLGAIENQIKLIKGTSEAIDVLKGTASNRAGLEQTLSEVSFGASSRQIAREDSVALEAAPRRQGIAVTMETLADIQFNIITLGALDEKLRALEKKNGDASFVQLANFVTTAKDELTRCESSIKYYHSRLLMGAGEVGAIGRAA
jgi:hypothetical protein